MKFVFGLLCCSVVAYAVLAHDSVGSLPYARMFAEFKEKYNRVYRNEVEVILMEAPSL